MPSTSDAPPVFPHPDAMAIGVSAHVAALGWHDRALFEALDIRLEPGQWTCLLGPSGVGKTTLLRVIAGLVPAGTEHRIQADDGQPLSGRVAWMSQQDLLLPWATVEDNVLLGARLRRQPPDHARAAALLAEAGLGAHIHALPGTLSGGQRQRVALVRTLMEDRPIILMDEPFSALDAITRLRLQTLAARLLAGRTVLLVTHDPLEALRLGHRVHVLHGRPARLGPALEMTDTTPREATDPHVLSLQADLLTRLAAADAAGAENSP